MPLLEDSRTSGDRSGPKGGERVASHVPLIVNGGADAVEQ